MKRTLGTGAVLLLLAGGATLAVLAYNTWSYCGGRCSAQTFYNPGPAGFSLFGLTLIAAFGLAWLRWRRQQSERRCRCRCGQQMSPGWLYCSQCGTPVPS
ncbi:MAG: hypothetical protein IH614_14110 [Desulfuromonadales bacterium]|nr:hypothetical protein [Desulfuromonadales bacterium]